MLTALDEGDAAVRDAESRAGKALGTMTDDEGLSVRQAADWCGDWLTMPEASLLRQLADPPDTSDLTRWDSTDQPRLIQVASPANPRTGAWRPLGVAE